jgi:nucleotide-binding universal stress UspA family protein
LAINLSKILVAIDGSDHSDYALNVAVKIGEKYFSGIDLVHVETSSSGTSNASSVKSDNLLDDRVEIVKERKLNCNPISIQSNDPAGEILKLANSSGYGLVVLGSRGLGGLKSLVMGSVSSKVAKECKRSVLVVKTRIEVVPKLLLGYDGSEESNKALDFAADLGVKFRSQVDAVCVFNIPVSPEAYIGTEVDRWEKDMRTTLESAVAKLKANGVRSQGKILDHTNVALALASEAEKGSYDIVVVGSRGQGRLKSLFLGSVASGIANSSKTNVLIIR